VLNCETIIAGEGSFRLIQILWSISQHRALSDKKQISESRINRKMLGSSVPDSGKLFCIYRLPSSQIDRSKEKSKRASRPNNRRPESEFLEKSPRSLIPIVFII
jgi:hypothetical protein